MLLKFSVGDRTTLHYPHLYWILGFVVFLAAVLRLYKLGEWSFWIDEIFTLQNAQNILNESITRQKLSTILIRASLDILGTNEWSARIVPALFGIALIVVLFLLSRKLFSSGVALLACLFLALSPWHIYLSQNSRYFTGFMLFYTLALFGLYFSLEEQRPLYGVTALVLAGLAFLERPYAVLLFPTLLAYVLLITWLSAEKLRYLTRRKILLPILLLPVMSYIIFELFNILSGRQTLVQSFFYRFVGYADWKPQWLVSGTIDALGTPLFCLVALGSVSLLMQKHKGGLLLALSTIVPLVILMVFALFARMNLHYYALVALPSLAILAAVGAKALYERARRGQVLTVLLVLLAMLGLSLRETHYEDAFYYFGEQMKAGLIVIAVLATALLIGSVLLKDRFGFSLAQAISLTLAVVFFLFLALNLSIAHVLYYTYQHGGRANWRDAAATIQERNQARYPVYTTLPQLGHFYMGDISQPIGDLLSRTSVDLNSTLNQSGAWFIEEDGVELLMGSAFETWAEANCHMVSNLDTYSGGVVRKMRVYFCNQSITNGDPIT